MVIEISKNNHRYIEHSSQTLISIAWTHKISNTIIEKHPAP